jgi:hypothetical protein
MNEESYEWNENDIVEDNITPIPIDSIPVSIMLTSEEFAKITKNATDMEMTFNEYIIRCATSNNGFAILKRIIAMNRMLKNLYDTMKDDKDISEEYRSRILSKVTDMSDTIEDIKNYLDKLESATSTKEETSNE